MKIEMTRLIRKRKLLSLKTSLHLSMPLSFKLIFSKDKAEEVLGQVLFLRKKNATKYLKKNKIDKKKDPGNQPGSEQRNNQPRNTTNQLITHIEVQTKSLTCIRSSKCTKRPIYTQRPIYIQICKAVYISAYKKTREFVRIDEIICCDFSRSA
jgi:hypothetical protein